jgi:hypothetical protein
VISFGRLHRLKVYRYRVGTPGFRWAWNTYNGDVCAQGRTNVIGAALVLGNYAYCVKWAKPTSRSSYEYARDVLNSLKEV